MSLEFPVKNKYFLTADVCGFAKIWLSSAKCPCIMEVNMRGGISYNSVLEYGEIIPQSLGKEMVSSNILVCALKTKEVKTIHFNLGNKRFAEIGSIPT